MNIDPKTYEYADDVLKDRIILITGATDGIGHALALHTASLGAQVILHGRNTRKLEAVHDEIEAISGAPRPSIAVLDLATATGDEYVALADSIEESFGRLDGLETESKNTSSERGTRNGHMQGAENPEE